MHSERCTVGLSVTENVTEALADTAAGRGIAGGVRAGTEARIVMENSNAKGHLCGVSWKVTGVYWMPPESPVSFCWL